MKLYRIHRLGLIVWMLSQTVFAIEARPFRLLEALSFQSAGDRITNIVFSPDEQRILSVDGKARVSLWNVADGSRAWQWTLEPISPDTDGITDARFSAPNTVQLELGDDTALDLNARTGKPLGKPHPGPRSLRAVTLERLEIKDEKLAAVDASAALIAHVLRESQDIILSDAKTKREIGRLHEWHGQVRWLRFSPDGKLLAAARDDGRVSLWDVNAREKRFNLRGHNPNAILSEFGFTWSENSSLLVTHDWATQIVWDVKTGLEVSRPKPDQSSTGAVYTANTSPSGKLLALGLERGVIDLIDARTGVNLRRIGFAVQKVVFSGDANTIYVAARDGRVRVFSRSSNGQYSPRDEFSLDRFNDDFIVLETRGLIVYRYASYRAYYDIGVYDLKTKTVQRYSLPANTSMSPLRLSLNPNRVWFNITFFDTSDGTSEQLTGACASSSEYRPDLNRQLCFLENVLSLRAFDDDSTIWKRSWSLGNTVYWSPSGSLLASEWLENKIVIMDGKTGATRALITVSYNGKPENRPGLSQMIFSPDESVLVVHYSGTDGDVYRYFDLKSRQELDVPPTMHEVLEAQFTPEGRALVTRTRDGLQFWALKDRGAVPR